MNYFYWQLDYSAQKPTSEKLPPYNGVIQHKHESLSVYSSDRILDSESASSNSERLGIVELHIWIPELWLSLFLQKSVPQIKVYVLHNYLQIVSLRS